MMAWRHPSVALGSIGICLCGCFLAALAIGAVWIPLDRLLPALVGRVAGLEWVERTVLFEIRLPRAVAGALVGAVLGVGGAAMQGLFRNPLADPGLIGVTSGASLGALLWIQGAVGLVAMWPALAGMGLPLAAFLGGLGATVLIYRGARVEGQTVVGLMLLGGIAINALGGAAIGLLLFFSDDQQLREFTFWTLGNLGRATWLKLAWAAPLFLLALVYLPRQARALNALLLGEAEAGHLGFTLERLRWRIVAVTAAGVGAAVAVAGGIGFIGLVAPHLVRQLLGPDHRWLMPGAALLGALLLLLADVLARTLAAPAELPVGVLTALVGAPVFFSLLRRRRRGAVFA
jgi:iron complex transport system permease protein